MQGQLLHVCCCLCLSLFCALVFEVLVHSAEGAEMEIVQDTIHEIPAA